MYNQLEKPQAVFVDSMPSLQSQPDLNRIGDLRAELQRQWYRDAFNVPVGLGFGLVGVLGFIENADKAIHGVSVPIPLWPVLLVFGLIGYAFSRAAFLNISERIAYARLFADTKAFSVAEGTIEKFGVRASRSKLYSQRIVWSSDYGRGVSPHLSYEILSRIAVGSRIFLAVPKRDPRTTVLLGIKTYTCASWNALRLGDFGRDITDFQRLKGILRNSRP